MEALVSGPQGSKMVSQLVSTKEQGFRSSISLVLPAFNEQEVIAQAVQEADAALSTLTDDYEILVVDDGSSDRTHAILEELVASFTCLRVLRQPSNLGYGAALRRGFETASKELVGFTDADCQFDLCELDRLVMLSRDYPIVCGYRIDRQDPFLRRFYSKGYNVLVRTLLGTQVRDCDCALKLFHRESLAKLPISTDGFLVNSEMLSQARQQDLGVVEVGVTHRPRAAGTSKVSILHIPVVLAALTRFWWNRVMFTCESGTESDRWSRQGRLAMLVMLLVIGGGAILSNLGYSLFEPDETRYAKIALNMHESGDWIIPRLNGEPYLDKPPLLYWLTAISYQLQGVSEQAARLPTALAALLTVLATYWFGRKLLGDRAAAIGSVLLLLSTGFFLAGRFIMMDSLLTLFTTVCFLAGAVALHARRWALTWWTFAGAACGLGILTKGPVAAVLCFPPLLAAAWLSQNDRIPRLRVALALLVPIFVIATPWYWMISSSQQEFSGHFFWKHNFERFFRGFNHQEPWWFYLPVLAIGLLPGSLLFGSLGVYLFGRGKTPDATQLVPTRTPQLGIVLLAAAWIVGFFSLSGCKLPAYVLPAFPMFCLLFGKMLSDVIPASSSFPMLHGSAQRARVHALRIAMVAGVAALGAHIVMSGGGLRWLAMGFLVVPALAWAWLQRGQRLSSGRVWLATTAVCLIVSAYGFDFVIPQFANWRSSSRGAALAQQQLQNPAPVVYFGRHKYGASFAIERGDVREFDTAQLENFEKYMAKHPQAVIVANRSGAELIRSQCQQSIKLVKSPRHRKVYIARATEGAAQLARRESATQKR